MEKIKLRNKNNKNLKNFIKQYQITYFYIIKIKYMNYFLHYQKINLLMILLNKNIVKNKVFIEI